MEERLRKFAGVVEAGSFTAAAAQLHISQPALTTAIKKLERELVTNLFINRKPPLKLTEAGEATYSYTKRLDAQNNNLLRELAKIAGQKPRVRIGMIDSMAQILFSQSDLMSGLKENNDLSVIINDSGTLVRYLKQGQLDMALIVEGGDYPFERYIRIRKIGDEPLVAVARQPISSSKNGAIDNLLGYDSSSNTDSIIRQHFRDSGIQTNITFRATDQQLLMKQALDGEGVAVISYYVARDALKNGDLIAVTSPILRPIVLREYGDNRLNFDIYSLKKRLSILLKKQAEELASLQSVV